LAKWKPNLGERPLGDHEFSCPLELLGAGPLGVESFEEPGLRPEGSNPEDGDEGEKG